MKGSLITAAALLLIAAQAQANTAALARGAQRAAPVPGASQAGRTAVGATTAESVISAARTRGFQVTADLEASLRAVGSVNPSALAVINALVGNNKIAADKANSKFITALAAAASGASFELVSSESLGSVELSKASMEQLKKDHGDKASDLKQALESMLALMSGEAYTVSGAAKDKAEKIADIFSAEMARGQHAAVAAKKAFEQEGIDYNINFEKACGIQRKGA